MIAVLFPLVIVRSDQTHGISSMKLLDFTRFRTTSLLKRSSSPIRFWFSTSSRLCFSFSFLCCNCRSRKALRYSLSSKHACLFSTRSHLARSIFKANSFRDKVLSANDFWKELRSRRGQCRLQSCIAICSRSRSSRQLALLFSREPFGRCSFLSCLAIRSRSRHSRYLVFRSCNLLGLCLFLSSLAMCCLSQDCKAFLREFAVAACPARIVFMTGVLSAPATFHASATAC